MPVKVKTPTLTLTTQIQKGAEERTKQVCANVLNYVGLEAVIEARDHGSYTDQTGNLRSSIGAVVTVDGKVFSDDSGKMYKTGVEGVNKGKEMLKEYASKRSGDISLHVVAGMEYADYVERVHNKNVLSSARVLVDAVAQKRLEMAGLKIKKR